MGTDRPDLGLAGGAGLAAVEAAFGAGTNLAPMDGARLLRFVGRPEDPWSNGLHLLLAPPTADDLRRWLATWTAFERPGRLRWSQPAGAPVDSLRAAVGDDLVLAQRSVHVGAVGAVPDPPDTPGGVVIESLGADPRGWAGFEVLARWADLDEDPEVWRWRARRVRHLVEGGRGVALLARTPSSPVGAVVRLDPPAHLGPTCPSAVLVVVHQAHRGRGVARGLVAAVVRGRGEVVVLDDADGSLAGAAAQLGLVHVEDLVEVGVRREATDRKA